MQMNWLSFSNVALKLQNKKKENSREKNLPWTETQKKIGSVNQKVSEKTHQTNQNFTMSFFHWKDYIIVILKTTPYHWITKESLNSSAGNEELSNGDRKQVLQILTEIRYKLKIIQLTFEEYFNSNSNLHPTMKNNT